MNALIDNKKFSSSMIATVRNWWKVNLYTFIPIIKRGKTGPTDSSLIGYLKNYISERHVNTVLAQIFITPLKTNKCELTTFSLLSSLRNSCILATRCSWECCWEDKMKTFFVSHPKFSGVESVQANLMVDCLFVCSFVWCLTAHRRKKAYQCQELVQINRTRYSSM